MNQWHCIINGIKRGPFTDAQVRQLAASGELRPSDQLRKEGLANWLLASQFKTLFPQTGPGEGGAAAVPPAPLPRNVRPPAAPERRPQNAPNPLPPPGQPPLPPYRPPAVASGTFKVFVKSPLKDVGNGAFQCQLAPAGITLTRKKRSPVSIPVGTPIDYVKGAAFTARLPRSTVNVRVATQTKYNQRLTRDLVAFLRRQGAAPVLSNYTLEWYYAGAIFLPLLGLVMWIGAIAWGINFCVVGLVMLIVQRESWNRWLRAALAYGIAVAFLSILLVVNVLAFFNAAHDAAPGKSGSVSHPPPRLAAPPAPGNLPPSTPRGPLPPENPAASPTPTAAELQAKLTQIPAFWRPAAGPPEDILSSMTVPRKEILDGALVLSSDDRLTSSKSYAAPVSFRIVAQTDSTNIRLAHAADQIIFNWEVNPDELRVDGGPADGAHQPGAGRVPVNQWVAIEWTVLPDQMIIYVDGQERYRHRADFSHIDKPLTIFPMGSTLRIHSVSVARP